MSTPFSILEAMLMQHQKPALQGALMVGRCRVIGKNVYDENDNPFIFRGYVQGHGELTTTDDSQDDKNCGANTVRIVWRKWGPYSAGGGTTRDGQGTGSPGDLLVAYLKDIVDRVRAAKAAGLKVILAGDSNCGQNGSQQYPDDMTTWLFCMVNGNGGQNFFTPDGQAQRALFYLTWQVMARLLYGLVDFYEPLVEPSAPNSNQAAATQLQDEVRTIIMKEDPFAIFIMGGYPGYQVPAMAGAFYAKWAADQNTILTCDMLDGAVNDTVNFPSKVATCVAARNTYNCPVMVNQVGSNNNTDPGGVNLKSSCHQLTYAAGGSIGFTIWEKTSQGVNGYGPFWMNGLQRMMIQIKRDACNFVFNEPQFAAV